MVKPVSMRIATEEDYKKLESYSIGTLHRASTLQHTAPSPAPRSYDLTNLPFDPAVAAASYSQSLMQEQTASPASSAKKTQEEP